MKTVCELNMCNGCMACVEKCHRNAITIKDDLKYYNALIDTKKCVDCGLCTKVCPRENDNDMSKPKWWYQGWADSEIREHASSGGAASAIIRAFIKHGGYVASCLLKCLDSILAQTFPNFEVIIIDDGSEDYYGNRLDELVQLDSRISVFHKKNEGVSVARNFGVNKATGQYILFVDGDDILTPWLLESAVQAVEDYDCDVIVGMINTTDKRPSIFPSREKNVKFELLDDHKKKELECHIFSKSCERWRPDQDGWEFNGEGCWAHFLKKEIALENQFIPGVAVGEDTIWALTMLNSSKDYRIGMLYEKWYYYIQNDYSVLNKYNPKIVGQLTLPVDILEKKYGASTGIVHAAYTDWLLMKLKHICFRAYLAEENTDPFNKKVSEFSKVLHTAPWIEVLNRRNTQPFKKRLKFFLYDKNIALYFYSCLKLVKRKKYDIEDGSRNESKN